MVKPALIQKKAAEHSAIVVRSSFSPSLVSNATAALMQPTTRKTRPQPPNNTRAAAFHFVRWAVKP